MKIKLKTTHFKNLDLPDAVVYERDGPLDELRNTTELHEKVPLTAEQVTPEVEDAALVEADEVPDDVVDRLTQTTSSPSRWNVSAHEV